MTDLPHYVGVREVQNKLTLDRTKTASRYSEHHFVDTNMSATD